VHARTQARPDVVTAAVDEMRQSKQKQAGKQ